MNSSTDRVCVTSVAANSVVVYDAFFNTVIASISVGLQPTGLAHNSLTNTVYCANRGSDSVSVIDGLSSTVIATITVGTSPMALSINP